MIFASPRNLAISTCLLLSMLGLGRSNIAAAQDRSESQQQKPQQDRREQLRQRFLQQRRERSKRDLANSRNSPAILSAFSQLTPTASKSVVRLLADDKPIALGCIVSPDGEVLTKASLLPESGFKCKLPGGQIARASKIAEDKQFDLALIKVEATDLVPLKFSEVNPAVGTLVTSANSDGTALGMGMVVTKPTRIANSRPSQSSSSGFLGVSVLPNETGIRVGQVIAGSAAQRAGVRVGDILLKIDAKTLSEPNDLRGSLGGKKAGDEIKLKLQSGADEARELKVKLGRRTSRQTQDRWGGGPFSKVRGGFPVAIRHDSVLRPEDCGGPLLTSRGEVVGINIARALRVSCYAVPTSSVTKALRELRTKAGVDTSRVPVKDTALSPAGE